MGYLWGSRVLGSWFGGRRVPAPQKPSASTGRDAPPSTGSSFQDPGACASPTLRRVGGESRRGRFAARRSVVKPRSGRGAQ